MTYSVRQHQAESQRVDRDGVLTDVVKGAAFLRALDAAVPGHVPQELLALLDSAAEVPGVLDLLVAALARPRV